MARAKQRTYALGVDVSSYDGGVDWFQVLKSGMSFGFARATMGAGRTDGQFATNWQRMGEVGITRGAYHFFHGAQDAVEQAKHFLDTVALAPTDLPPVLDIEGSGADGQPREALIAGAQAWLDAVEQATGRIPLVYTGFGFWTSVMRSDAFGRYPLWLARYTQAPVTAVPRGWSAWTFWQYAAPDDGAPHIAVPGIADLADVSRYNGTHDDLVRQFGLRAGS